MADQITTVAALPAGYGTLAGAIYAIIASPPAIWNDIAWAKMGRVPSLFRRSKEDPTSEAGVTPGASVSVFKLHEALSRSITKRMRRFGPFELDYALKRDIAALHVLSLWSASSLEPDRARRRDGDEHIFSEAVHQQDKDGVTTSIRPGSIILYRKSVTSLSSDTAPLTNICPLCSSRSEEIQTLDVRLQVVQYTGNRFPAQPMIYKLSVKDLEDAVASTLQGGDIYSFLGNTPIDCMINSIRSSNSTAVVLVQAAAPLNILAVEVAYKSVEVLLACAIILGSTGGAWLGLTLSSIFPRRTAAGLFVSSYGQLLGGQMGDSESRSPYPWPPVGTVWSETEGHAGYCVLPHVKLPDEWRNAIGYWIQLFTIMVYRHFKFEIRYALEFGPYVFTRDAIRYIVLLVEPFLIAMSGTILHQKLRKPPGRYSRRNILAIGVYFTMLSASLAVVVLGQKAFLNPSQSSRIGELVDLLAAAGSVAMINIKLENETSLPPEKWILIWAIGFCTVVW